MPAETPKVLVTGATGFLGSALVNRLATNRRYRLVAAVRKTDSASALPCESVAVGDLSGDTDWSRALDGVNVVIHCAARNQAESGADEYSQDEYRRVNLEASVGLARQVAAAGVSRLIFISSIKVHGSSTDGRITFTAQDTAHPADSYARSKWAAECALRELAMESGFELVIVRPPLVYGPGVKANFLKLLRLVDSGLPLPLGSVDNRRSLVGLENLVDLILICIGHPAARNEIFLAADGEDLSTAELVGRIATAMEKPARLLPCPVWLLRSLAAVTGKTGLVRRLTESLQVDISGTTQALGWSPPLSVDQGLRRTIEAYRQADEKTTKRKKFWRR